MVGNRRYRDDEDKMPKAMKPKSKARAGGKKGKAKKSKGTKKR